MNPHWPHNRPSMPLQSCRRKPSARHVQSMHVPSHGKSEWVLASPTVLVFCAPTTLQLKMLPFHCHTWTELGPSVLKVHSAFL